MCLTCAIQLLWLVGWSRELFDYVCFGFDLKVKCELFNDKKELKKIWQVTQPSAPLMSGSHF